MQPERDTPHGIRGANMESSSGLSDVVTVAEEVRDLDLKSKWAEEVVQIKANP